MKLSKYGEDVAENLNCRPGGQPGSVQPATCAGCGVARARMAFPRLADGRKYWRCKLCGYLHESEDSQGTARGLSAYPNKFKVGDHVRRPGEWLVYRVEVAHRSHERNGGFFSGVLVTRGAKYHKPGKRIFEHASYYVIEPDPARFDTQR